MAARRPPIVITSRDYDRLDALLNSLPAGAFPNKSALEGELERAKIVPAEQVPPDVVTMNSTVRFTIAQSGEEFELMLVYPKDAAQPDRVSVLAPVGSALLGLAVGTELDWPAPGGGVSTVRVTGVVYQPERAGDLHR
jgi:regulator of nucleoside diphosphate kinase